MVPPAPAAQQPATPPAGQPVVTPVAPAQPAPVPAPPAPAGAPTAPATGAAQPTAKPAAPPPAPAAPQAAAPTTAQPPVQIAVNPPGAEFRVGQGPYPVALTVTNIVRVSTISLTLTYDPARLRIRSLQEGSFMRQGTMATAFAHQEDNAAGRVDITISRTGDTVGATGSGTLAALVFEAITPGLASLRVSGVASGPAGAIPLQFSQALVTVK